MSNILHHPHSHHVSLLRNSFTVRSLLNSFADREDPYYEIDGLGSFKGVNCPAFNISETETAFILNGEFAGLSDKKQIIVEWMDNQLLMIHGSIAPGDTETMTDPFEKGLKNEIPSHDLHETVHMTKQQMELRRELGKPVFPGPKALLRERHIGNFQRSFTFPTEVDPDHMEANLANGLLRIVVKKMADSEIVRKQIEVK